MTTVDDEEKHGLPIIVYYTNNFDLQYVLSCSGKGTVGVCMRSVYEVGTINTYGK